MSDCTFALCIIRNGTITTSNYAGPAYQVISLTKPLKCLPKLSVCGTPIRNVSSIIQIEHHWTLEKSCSHPFNQGGTEVHSFALYQDHVSQTRSESIYNSKQCRFG